MPPVCTIVFYQRKSEYKPMTKYRRRICFGLIALFGCDILMPNAILRTLWSHHIALATNPQSNYSLYSTLVGLGIWMKIGYQTAFFSCLAVFANIAWREKQKSSARIVGILCLLVCAVIVFWGRTIAPTSVIFNPESIHDVDITVMQYIVGFFWLQTLSFVFLYFWSSFVPYVWGKSGS